MQIKRVLSLTSLGVIALSGIVVYLGENIFCSHGSNIACVQSFDSFGTVILPLVPLFLFSLITYFLPMRFFQAWYKFALVWTALAMIAIFFVPEYSGQLMYAITKGSVAFYSAVLFCVISISIVLFTLFRDEK